MCRSRIHGLRHGGGEKYALQINALNLFGDPHLTVELVGVYSDNYDKGQNYDIVDDNPINSDVIWQKAGNGDVTPFKPNGDGLLTDLNLVNNRSMSHFPRLPLTR